MAKKTRFQKCVDSVSARGGATDPRGVCAAAGRKKYGGKKFQAMAAAGKRRKARASNPAAESAEVFEEFHGYPPDETLTFKQDVHFHRHLAAAGELEFLKILTPDKSRVVTLADFKGTVLTFNEKKTQLFCTGGDQTVDLKLFAIDPTKAHEVETLGCITQIGYFGEKTHLGKEGGVAIYEHRFRSTNQNGKHVTVKIAKYPDAIYYVRDRRIVFSGGSYEIRAEGIDK